MDGTTEGCDQVMMEKQRRMVFTEVILYQWMVADWSTVTKGKSGCLYGLLTCTTAVMVENRIFDGFQHAKVIPMDGRDHKMMVIILISHTAHVASIQDVRSDNQRGFSPGTYQWMVLLRAETK